MKRKNNPRIVGIGIIFVFSFFIITLKIAYLQVFKGSFFRSLAQSQHYRLLHIEGKRGEISDRLDRALATDIYCYSVFADPSVISLSGRTADVLSEKLNISKEYLSAKLSKKKKRFVWIKRKVSLQTKEEIKALRLEGVGFIREEKRFYPQGSLLSSVLGITDIDNRGLEGLELFYNDYLSGKDGWVKVLQDSFSREVMLSSQIMTPQRGANLVLTIDAQIQYWVESSLEDAIKEFDAVSGSVMVMDALSGEILALANYPGFDPNNIRGEDSSAIRNRAVCDMFEPGSVFKVVTLLAAINENKFSDEDNIFCENGELKIPGTILHDWKPYGNLTFKEVFMKSSNIGVAKIVQSLGPEVFSRYLKRLDFGKASGIDLPGEVKGSVVPFGSWSKTSPYIIPIGQEIGVNLIQMVRVFAAVVNEGYLVSPHLVKSICSRGICKELPFQRKKIFPSSVAERAKNILIEVVSNGTGKRAGIEGMDIGGKTGTAQKYDPAIGRYSPNKYRATFIGFIAGLDTPLVIGVTVDEPKKSHFGGVVAAPLFRKIAEKVIKYARTNKYLVKQ